MKTFIDWIRRGKEENIPEVVEAPETPEPRIAYFQDVYSRRKSEAYPYGEANPDRLSKLSKGTISFSMGADNYHSVLMEKLEDATRSAEKIIPRIIPVSFRGNPWDMEKALYETAALFGANVAWNLSVDSYHGSSDIGRHYVLWKGSGLSEERGLIDSASVDKDVMIAFNLYRASQIMEESLEENLHEHFKGGVDLEIQGVSREEYRNYGNNANIEVLIPATIEEGVENILYSTAGIAQRVGADVAYMHGLTINLNPDYTEGITRHDNSINRMDSWMEFYRSPAKIQLMQAEEKLRQKYNVE